MNIIEASTDVNLFGAQFGGESWTTWRALLGGFYGVEVIDRDLFYSITQREPDGPWQELWLPVGRRGGKSRIASLVAIFEAAFKDHRDRLAPGEFATVMVVAADRRQARTVHRYIRGLINGNAMLRRMVVRETEDVIELNNRCAIEIATASFRSIRGYTVSCAIFDEIAYWSSDGANPDSEVLAGIRPALATLGGKLVALSSPYARRGVLWDVFRKHYGGDSRRVLVAKAPSLIMNPTLDPAIVEEALQEDHAAASAEWLAEFRGDIEGFVTRELVEAAIEPGVRVRAPLAEHRYEAFVDPSGGASDSMTLAIGHREQDRALLDCLVERRAPFSPESVVGEFSDVLKSYRISKVKGDRYAGEWPREAFSRHGISYEPAEQPKSALYQNLLPLLTSGRADLLDESRLVAQLCGLERRTARGGRDTIDHAPGQHDDVANAVAGVLVSVELEKKSTIVSCDIWEFLGGGRAF